MENVTEELYKRFQENFVDTAKDNPFYKYYYNLLDTGTVYSKFFNRKLLKEIDEEWVTAIETALPHIQYVIDHPRTFIEEDRQIVSVAVAKKFTVESIRHMAQHSEMVDRIKPDGMVEPNKVLNIFKEESLNTYENRFINTLLKELRDFVNKRAEVIFERSKNEDGVKLDIDGTIDNYSEVVTYKLEMRIREKQTDMSNDKDNMNIFNRVSSLHRQVNDMASSGFMLSMMPYPLVKHPVVKTNAIAKNVHYKECYNLWNFIHSYERIGYKVELIEQDPVINRKFEADIYNFMLLNYVILREHMTNKDILKFDKGLKPKEYTVNYIQQFVKDLVYEYDISESDLKQLFLSELVKAQSEKREIMKKAEEIKTRAEGKIRAEEENSLDSWNTFLNAQKQETTAKEETEVSRSTLTKREKDRLRKAKNQKKKQMQKEQEEQRRLKQQKALEERMAAEKAEAEASANVENDTGNNRADSGTGTDQNDRPAKKTGWFARFRNKT